MCNPRLWAGAASGHRAHLLVSSPVSWSLPGEPHGWSRLVCAPSTRARGRRGYGGSVSACAKRAGTEVSGRQAAETLGGHGDPVSMGQ